MNIKSISLKLISLSWQRIDPNYFIVFFPQYPSLLKIFVMLYQIIKQASLLLFFFRSNPDAALNVIF